MTGRTVERGGRGGRGGGEGGKKRKKGTWKPGIADKINNVGVSEKKDMFVLF